MGQSNGSDLAGCGGVSDDLTLGGDGQNDGKTAGRGRQLKPVYMEAGTLMGVVSVNGQNFNVPLRLVDADDGRLSRGAAESAKSPSFLQQSHLSSQDGLVIHVPKYFSQAMYHFRSTIRLK